MASTVMNDEHTAQATQKGKKGEKEKEPARLLPYKEPDESPSELVLERWSPTGSVLDLVRSTLGALVGSREAQGLDVDLPEHWRDQIKQLSKGKRRQLQRYYEIVEQINALENGFMEMTDAQLRSKTDVFRERVAAGESLESILPEAFACVREASKRALDMRHFDCQMVGGIVLHEGKTAEMDTGEGKTLVATLPVYLNALTGKGVHVVTVNEYLATRDAQWMGKIYTFLGLTVASVKEEMDLREKKTAYASDVIYVTATQLCFDHLHDCCATSAEHIALGELNYAIVDEVDSILIDESRNPMILSTKSREVLDRVELAAEVCHELLHERGYGKVNRLLELADAIHAGRLPTTLRSSPNVPRMQLQMVSEALAVLLDVLVSGPTHRMPNLKRLPDLADIERVRAGVLRGDPDLTPVAVYMLMYLRAELKGLRVYKPDIHAKKVTVTETGAVMLKELLGEHGEQFDSNSPVSLWESTTGGDVWGPYLVNALKATEFFRRGIEYIVMNGEVVIVDEATGRLRVKSRWEDGIHQAVEAKERVLQDKGVAGEGVVGNETVEVKPQNYTIASVTFQVFFKYYKKLAGMSGTAVSEQQEFYENYNLTVVKIPTHRPRIRIDRPNIVYLSEDAKMQALIMELMNCQGVRPVLIGTNSIQESEKILEKLKMVWTLGRTNEVLWDGEKHFSDGKLVVLNARPEFVKAESQIVAQAGIPGMVTIATNMAGRGTDILLGGNAKGLTESALYRLVFSQVMEDVGALDGIPKIPLPEFRDDGNMMSGLPPSLYGHLQKALLRCRGPSEEAMATFSDVEAIMESVMDVTEKLKILATQALRPNDEHAMRLRDLDFEQDIRPVVRSVLTAEESMLEKLRNTNCCVQNSGPRQALIEAAIHTWLWFEQKCELYGDMVRKKGGILVIGVSLSESKRIENQLRGRSGRQGDPGESIMFMDTKDPMIETWGFESVRKLLESSAAVLGSKIESADIVIDMIRGMSEQYYRRMRMELKRFDEVMEEFRQQRHFLRNIILKGTDEERTQLVYSWFQEYMDLAVDRFAPASEHPSEWALWRAPPKSAQQPQSPGSAGAPQGTGGEDATVNLENPIPEREEDCKNLEDAIELLFNPPDRTFLFTILNFKQLVGPTVMKGLETRSKKGLDALDIGISPSGLDILEGDGDLESQTTAVNLPIVRVIPLTDAMKKELEDALSAGKDPVHRPSYHFGGEVARCPVTDDLQRALDARQEIAAKQEAEAQVQKGRYRKQARMLREYLGELAALLYEERKGQLVADMCREDGFAPEDAEFRLMSLQKATMLELMDSYWSLFLQATKRLQQAAFVRAFSRASPLEEFSIEAHREFVSLLQQYRQAVIMNLATPEVSVSIAPPEAEADGVTPVDAAASAVDPADNDELSFPDVGSEPAVDTTFRGPSNTAPELTTSRSNDRGKRTSSPIWEANGIDDSSASAGREAGIGAQPNGPTNGNGEQRELPDWLEPDAWQEGSVSHQAAEASSGMESQSDSFIVDGGEQGEFNAPFMPGDGPSSTSSSAPSNSEHRGSNGNSGQHGNLGTRQDGQTGGPPGVNGGHDGDLSTGGVLDPGGSSRSPEGGSAPPRQGTVGLQGTKGLGEE